MSDKNEYPILGIDIGATTIKYAALHAGGSLSGKGVQQVTAAGNAALVAQLAAIIGSEEFAGISTVGIGSPGPLDIEKGIIVASANMPAVKNCEIIPELKKLFPQKQIRLDNDANAATLGEKYFGAGKNLADFAVFTLGTGVGGGCIWQNRLQRGINGNFFEVGHIPLAAFNEEHTEAGRICGCGNRGCLETYASATGISHSYRQATGDSLSAADIAKRAAESDKHAQAAYETAGRALGIAAATITQTMNLTTFIMTGGVAAAERQLRPAFEAGWRAHTLAIFHPLLQLTFTRGDEDAGIRGAAALFIEKA